MDRSPIPSRSHLGELPLPEIEALCRRFRVRELALFGSVLREDFGPGSDVDLLVRFEPGAAGPWMQNFERLEDELARLFGRTVDLVDRQAVEESRNWLRRREILGTAQVVYAA